MNQCLDMEKVSPDVAAELDKIFELDKSIRGPFLIQAIAVDEIVSDIISQYFCPDVEKRHLFFSLIINGGDLAFSDKINIFDKMLQLVYPDLANQHDGIKDRLDKIRKFRNRLAHAMPDTSEEYLLKKYQDRIRLVYFEDGARKQQELFINDTNKRLGECTKVIEELTQIQRYVEDHR